jgi:hypothetical protein
MGDTHPHYAAALFYAQIAASSRSTSAAVL